MTSNTDPKAVMNMGHFTGVLDQYQNAILQCERKEKEEKVVTKSLMKMRRKRKELRNLIIDAYRNAQRGFWRDFHQRRDQNDDYSI